MKKIPLIFALLLTLITVSCAPANSTAIQASGQIEATEIAVAPELSGRVVEVNVSEGDSVKAGDPLLRLDDSLLLSQKKSAQAALDSAKASVQAAQATLDSVQAQYDLALSVAQAENKPARVDAWRQTKLSQFDQPVWYFTQDETIASAKAEVDTAQQAVIDAQANLTKVEQAASNTEFTKVETRLSNARVAFQVAKTVLDRANAATNRQDLHDAAQKTYDDAKRELEDAQSAYDDALTTSSAKDVLKARAKVITAVEHYNAGLDYLYSLQTGSQSPTVTAASKAVDQAKATLEQAKSAVSAAQANLDMINTQMDKLVVHATTDGVVLTRSVEVGEVIQAGMPAMTIGKLDTLKVTVYIPETEYGQISLGQQASLSVDSFPNESFPARVTRIANQAEFTPQNVQTKEGRQTTVYAIELTVNNTAGKLKPGMPTDVTFANQVAGK